MNLSNNAKNILNFISESLTSQLDVSLPDSDDFRNEYNFKSIDDSRVSLAVGLSDGVYEISIHERRVDSSNNLLYATVVLDQPENSATMTVTSDSDDTLNCELIFPIESIANRAYESTVQTVVSVASDMLAALEPIQ